MYISASSLEFEIKEVKSFKVVQRYLFEMNINADKFKMMSLYICMQPHLF